MGCCSAYYKRKRGCIRMIHPRCVTGGFCYFNKIPISPIVVFCAALISLVGSNLK